MFDAKAADSETGAKEELRAIARHVRRRVKAICDQALVRQDLNENEKFWVLATLYEACVGLGQEDEAQDSKNEGDKISTAQWMTDTRDNQAAKLGKLLDK